MTVLVTGASGFVGSHIVAALQDNGASVRGLVRASSETALLRTWRVHLVQGDLLDLESLRNATRGVETVYHAAGVVSGRRLPLLPGPKRDPALMDWVNVQGTQNLLTACVENQVRRVVLISSVSVYLPAPSPITEEVAIGGGGAYGQSKAGAEAAVQACAAQHGLEWVILRPCTIYGERDSGFTRLLLRILGWPVVIVSDDDWPSLELVHVADVVTAAMLAGTRSRAQRQIYNITGGQGATLREIVKIYKEVTGRKRLVISVPEMALKQVLGSRVHPMRRYSIDKARRELGYQPQISLTEGLHRMLDWFCVQKTK
jgi:nucleoside-diphosphate-sugar epimerase